MSYIAYDKCHITKMTYINMGIKISVSTYTMQSPASKLSEVHFNILDLKNKNGPISVVFSEIIIIIIII
jgi:hypothetical protein